MIDISQDLTTQPIFSLFHLHLNASTPIERYLCPYRHPSRKIRQQPKEKKVQPKETKEKDSW